MVFDIAYPLKMAVQTEAGSILYLDTKAATQMKTLIEFMKNKGVKLI